MKQNSDDASNNDENYLFQILQNPLKTFDLKVQNFECLNHNPAFLICLSEKCQSPGIMCENTKCQCFKNHKKCQYTRLQSALINFKPEIISYPIKETYNTIINCYNNIIQHLSNQKQKFQQEIQFYKKTQKQIDFLRFYRDQKFENITGKLMSEIKQEREGQPQVIKVLKLTKQIQQIYSRVSTEIFDQMNFFNQYDTSKFRNHKTWRGEVNKEGKYDGYGTLRKKNIFKFDPIYIGQWKNGQYQGRGKQYLQNGFIESQYKNGKKHGKVGIYLTKDNYSGQGNYVNGLQQGIFKIRQINQKKELIQKTVFYRHGKICEENQKQQEQQNSNQKDEMIQQNNEVSELQIDQENSQQNQNDQQNEQQSLDQDQEDQQSEQENSEEEQSEQH